MTISGNLPYITFQGDNFSSEIIEPPFRVTDLKQWMYCPRILYYILCTPTIRPKTYKMDAGIDAGQVEVGREQRRSMQPYGLIDGRREFAKKVASNRLGLRGEVDMVIYVDSPGKEEVIPVDYKLSQTPGQHFKLQIAAYGLLLEDATGFDCKRGFLYMIPSRKTEEVRLTKTVREKVLSALDSMHVMFLSEAIPPATNNRGRCIVCEFRRFCNDTV